MKNNRTAIHITDKASNTQIINCDFEGFDVGIKDEGKNTKILNSLFKGAKKLWHEHLLARLVIELVLGLLVLYLAFRFGWNK